MKKKWFAFGCLTSIIIVIALLFWGFHSLKNLGKKKVKVQPDSYLHLNLSGEITEYNEIERSIFFEKPICSNVLIRKINRAATDENIKGILLEPTWIQAGLATTHEIMKALQNFQSKGKEVHAYMEISGNRDYFLASVADRVYLNPSASAGILLTGIGGNIIYYKELLDKIGVEIKVIHAGKYKGAGEQYFLNEMSQPLRKSLEDLLSDIYDELLTTVAENRNISFDDVKDIYENRTDIMINKDNALQYQLVDELIFRENLLARLNIKKHNLISYKDYNLPKEKSFTKDKIAVIYAQGNISQEGTSSDFRNLSAKKFNKNLDLIIKDSSIKALVIRVDCPGGSALESEIILNKIIRLKEIMPVVVSMANVAGSGGYYIVSNSSYIFADPFVITGSIGVVGTIPNFKKLGDKIGIHSNVIKKGKYANILDPFTEIDPQVIESIRQGVQETYDEFKARVAFGRDMSLEQVEEIAQGRLWSCDDALENNLIDEVGFMSDAIQKAAELAGIKSFTRIYYPRKKTFEEMLLKDIFNIEMYANIFTPDIHKELGTRKAIQFYRNIQYDPIQAIMPFEELE